MNHVELLREALELATRLGYEVRHECLMGAAGGTCEVAGQRYLFVDLGLRADEQLDQVMDALQADPALQTQRLPTKLQAWQHPGRAA